ncbi:MAG: hypothetical protein HZA01_11740 [Nitrospinae bacterium]|nr:hypothetical protein [Nitrospinota bacterium]
MKRGKINERAGLRDAGFRPFFCLYAAVRKSLRLRVSAVYFPAVLLVLLAAGPSSAADWSMNYGGTTGQNAYTQATAVDASGNVYIAGDFTGATFTLGGVILTRIGTRDAFAAKLDASGTVL